MSVNLEKQLKEIGVVPVVAFDDAKDAKELAKALAEGGLPCAEVTFRTEAAQAVKRGMKIVKFFPAESFGGIATIKALAAPYTTLMFMPTGGINKKNLHTYLECNKVFCCGGSWMVKKDMIAAGEFDKICSEAKEASALVKEIRG